MDRIVGKRERTRSLKAQQSCQIVGFGFLIRVFKTVATLGETYHLGANLVFSLTKKSHG